MKLQGYKVVKEEDITPAPWVNANERLPEHNRIVFTIMKHRESGESFHNLCMVTPAGDWCDAHFGLVFKPGSGLEVTKWLDLQEGDMHGND